MVLAGLLTGQAAPAFAQEEPPLKGTVDETDAELPMSWPAVTTLAIQPLETPPPAPRHRRPAGDPYAPQGIDAGGLRLFPSITVGGVYSTNVTTSDTNAEDDFGLALRPSLRFESDWVRHSWTGTADGDLIFYASHNDLDTHDLHVAQRLRLDVRHTTRAEIAASYRLDQTGIADSGVPATATGYRTEHTLAGSAGLIQDFGPMSAAVTAGIKGRIYEDVKLSGGGTEDNKDRDYVEPSLSLRTTYTDPPVLKPYVEASYTPRIHTLSHDRNGLRRDSQGIGVEAGVGLDAGPLWLGELGFTYLHRNYDDSALDPIDTFGLAGSVTWSPTELTRVIMSAGTAINETTSPNQSGNPEWSARLDVSRAVRDNVDVSAGGGVKFEDVGGGIDMTYDANLGLSWKLNPDLSWTAGYDVTWLDAGTPGRSYTEHRISTGLTLSR